MVSDISIVLQINQLTQRSVFFDNLMVIFVSNNLIKSIPIVSAIWYFWFLKSPNKCDNQNTIIATLIAGLTGLVTARALALTLPFRLRPMHEGSLNLQLPFGFERQSLHGWSSFPSDHAVLFFALSTGIFFISRRVGWALFLYTIVFTAFPRLYVGLHYPTDLLGGMIFGALWASLIIRLFKKSNALLAVIRASEDHPQFFYPVFGFLLFQLSEMFDSVRIIVGAFHHQFLH